MKKILIIFSNIREKMEVVDFAIKEAKKVNGHITFLYILDEAIPREFSIWLMYMGFLGEKLTEEIREVIKGEIEKDSKEIIKKIKKRFVDEKIPHNLVYQKGDFNKIVEDFLKKEKFDIIILPKARETLSGKEEKIKFKFNYREL